MRIAEPGMAVDGVFDLMEWRLSLVDVLPRQTS